MFVRKSLPVGTLFIILAIALAFLGVGYALWSETLTISGTVQTGEVDVEFSTSEPVECVDVNGVETCPEPQEKASAANCTVEWLGGDTDPDGDNGANQLNVAVTGMYPSYHCKVSFDVTSTGNVPVHVWRPEPVGDIPVWVATNFEECYDDGVQLHLNESTQDCTIDIHFTNDQAPLENSGPHTFSWTILATQWNEDPSILVVGNEQSPSTTGWFGWSCPDTHPYVVGGGVSYNNTQPFNDVPEALTNFVLAKPGATLDGFTYPSFPHYNYPGGEQGIAVHNQGGASPQYPYIYCSATAP